MSTRVQIVCTTANPKDTKADAERLAETLRGQGLVVKVGEVFDLPYGHKAGMPAVELTISDGAPEESQPVPVLATSEPAPRQPIVVPPDTRFIPPAVLQHFEERSDVPLEEQKMVPDDDLSPTDGFAVASTKAHRGRKPGSKNKPKVGA